MIDKDYFDGFEKGMKPRGEKTVHEYLSLNKSALNRALLSI